MLKILIATHGTFANGVKSALEIILGEKNHVSCLNAFMNEQSLNELIETYFTTISSEDSLIILTDLFGGSVNQTLISALKREKTWLICGFNLALVLEICLLDETSQFDESQICEIVMNAKNEIQLMNAMIKNYKHSEDFD